MSNVSRLPGEEMLYRYEATSRSGKQATWRPKQKNSSRKKDMVRTFRRYGDVVVDFCAYICFTAKAYT